MVPFQRPNRLFLLVIFSFSTVLAACSSGGGGKGGPAPNPADTRPDSFTITASAGEDPSEVPFDTEITSAPITITGIDAAAAVSINNGEFQIDNGTFTSTAGTVRSGQTITVRVRSSVKAGQSVTATLNVGGVTAPFTVTTGPDTEPPEVAILFPPPASMTEGSTLFLRGTVKDVNGTLEEGAVTVNGVEAALELNAAEDEGTWSVTVDLAEGLNSIAVTAEDAEGNLTGEQSVDITKAPIASAFPDENSPFVDPVGITLSSHENVPVAYVTEPSLKAVLTVDLTSGTRRILSDNNLQSEDPFERPWRLTSGADSILYVTDRTNGNIYSVDVETGNRTVVPIQDTSTLVRSPRGIVYFNNKLYVAHGQSVLSIDLISGILTSLAASQSSYFSNVIDLAIDTQGSRIIALNSDPVSFTSVTLPSENSEFYEVGDLEYSEAITIDRANNQIYTVDALNARVLRFDGTLSQGADFTQIGSEYPENPLIETWGVANSPELGFLVIADRGLKGLVAMDTVSGRRVIISKSATPVLEE
ncbi:MAG: hypothetical protein NVV73_20585 [Cellvibrionaceae bacterium]|nr:hypothetical protein [Cellvibrionaceae bacterium]